MKDIVLRLRYFGGDGKGLIGEIVHEAADEIERLRAALKEIAEKSEDIATTGRAYSALMHLKRRALEQKADK